MVKKKNKTYTVKEVAKKLDVCDETVRRYIRSGRLKKVISPKQKSEITEKELKRFMKTPFEN